MLKCVIIEDNLFFGQALQQVINEITEAQLLCSFTDAETAIEKIPGLNPNIVIADIQLSGKLSGIDVIKALKPKYPFIEFLVCTVYDDSETVVNAIKHGATGYILKDSTFEEIKNAVIELVNGGSPMSPFIARKLIESFRNETPAAGNNGNLTIREKEILKLLATGLLYKEIADRLEISRTTVKKHIHNMYEKLHVNNKIEAINKFKNL